MAVTLNNLSNGETVHQRAVILIGQSESDSFDEDFLAIHTGDSTKDTFPRQNWPLSQRQFKSLVILSPGTNSLVLEHCHDGKVIAHTSLTITYVPLLQTPPLHLAIMIAKDSPLLIDCPPNKRGALSSAHSDLDAAINKFRMTAYMWQALTAEDMRSKGLGRRSFRLEEEWTAETLSREFLQSPHGASADHMRSTAKIHLIRSDKTVEELRDPQVAQQNEQARRRDDLHKYFEAALKKHGGPFASSAHPIVAGLILDSTFSAEQELILGHAALGCSNPQGLSLGVFGSHLTYSWPRFLEEVSSSLLDSAVPGDTVGNDNNECGTMWEACSIGQGAFLHEVGHAFGAPHTSGIMARGYAQDWPKNFLAQTGFCSARGSAGITVDDNTPNDARWDLSDALSFKVQPHFTLPDDVQLPQEALTAEPSTQIVHEEDQAEFLRLVISSPAQIVRVKFNDVEEPEPTIATPVNKIQFTMDELESRFERSKPLTLDVLGMNGKSRLVGNVWRLFSNVSFIRVPCSSIVLQKRGVMSQTLESEKNMDSGANSWDWAVMLKEKGKDGTLSRATAIDSRVGCLLDGAVVYYEDGHKTPCGPRWSKNGHDHHFGGHASEKFHLSEGVDIVKVEVGRNHQLNGLRFHMSNGTKGGYLYPSNPKHALEAAENERIIGFYGRSDWGRGWSGIEEFGIITAPKDVELPESIYDLPELQNTDGGNGPRSKLRNDNDEDEDEDMEDESDQG
ncbi:related to jacalin-like lectin domain-containing protein [Phialocephala subalpina]|uniref:Related to jacalin-like lectin domain-containing protein n=1 Tax=Phialocephala subalpina TaxID=576137 RepID=A0A1L7XWI4_9HELO|nr:related to jacalin-like lectin domain-containing protein [Phialocephala subalpina]